MASPRKSDRRARPRRLERIVIEAVSPELDAGRYPAKRIVGDVLSIGADIMAPDDGEIAARVMYKAPDASDYASLPMAYDDRADRWFASLVLDQPGRWSFAIEAWTDRFATWRTRLQKRVAAEEDVAGDLVEGGVLARAASRSARSAGPRASLLMTAKVLEDRRNATVEKRVQRALDDDFLALMREYYKPGDLTRFTRDVAILVDGPRARAGAWYEFSHESLGTFAAAVDTLTRIAELGLDVAKLPALQPTGSSPIDPAMGTVDDFDRFAAAARALGVDVALGVSLDIAPNDPWVAEHEGWFNPHPDHGAPTLDLWNDDRDGLWNAIRDRLLFWVEHGVSVFCVENPHRSASALWEWLIGSLHHIHPDVLFVAESFVRPKAMKHLAKLGFALSYTYFMWKTTPAELRETFEELVCEPMSDYYRGLLFVGSGAISNEYLANGRAAYRARLLLAATLLPHYGIDSGFERDNADRALDDDIRLLNGIRTAQPALRESTNLAFLDCENPALLFYRKAGRGIERDVLVVVNTDPRNAQEGVVYVPIVAFGIPDDEPYVVHDLLTGARFTWRGVRNYVRLDPAEQAGHLFVVERAPGGQAW